MNLPSSFHRHAPLTSPKEYEFCWVNNETPQVFRNQVLAAKQTTDALMLDFSSCLLHFANNRKLLWTLAQALQISGAKLLELDSRELGTLVIPAGDMGVGLGAVLYDDVPGGAGHVRELLAFGREWLLEARRTMFVSDKHNEVCETACLDCLLTFDAQEPMRRGFLNRRLAIRVLDALLAGENLPVAELNASERFVATSMGSVIPANGEAILPIPEQTVEERLHRGKRRMADRSKHS